MSTKSNRIPGLDLLRAAAITAVFLFHYSKFAHPAWLSAMSSQGWMGVDLFFVLSGYLIAAHLFENILKHKINWLSNFFVQRALRILPAYFVVLACYFTFPIIREGDKNGFNLEVHQLYDEL